MGWVVPWQRWAAHMMAHGPHVCRPQAIALQPAHGIHLLHSNRSAALQSRGEHGAALQSAIDALEAAPADFVAVSSTFQQYMLGL